MLMRLLAALTFLWMSSSAAYATGVDIAGRSIVGPEGKIYFPDASSATAIRVGAHFLVSVAPRARSVPRNIIPPTGYPVFNGDGEDFGFYDVVSYSVGSWPNAVAIADVNGDGRNDVILATTFYFDPDNDYHIFVFIQDVDGSLMPPVAYAYAGTTNTVGLVTARLHDGTGSDIAVGTDSGINVFLATSSGLATPAFYLGQKSDVLAGIDANLDGNLDILGLSWSDNAPIYVNDGSGDFATTSTLATHDAGYDSMRARDLDGDGLDDLLVASGQGASDQSINVHWQVGDPSVSGSGSLSAPTTFGPPQDSIWYADAGDINSDRKADIVASRAYNSPTWLWHFDGQGNHAFAVGQAYPSYDIPETVVVADINLDGRQDIVTLHGGWNAAGLYLQARDSGMRPEQLFSIPYASHYSATGLAIGDINRDGCPDAVIADYNQGLVILYGHDCSDEIFQSDLE
ncbi:MAG: VCBS repeat-containing protein [Rudaea sp.]